VLFYVCGRFYLLKCYCWKAKMVRHGRTHVRINYAPCHLPNVDGQMDPFLVVVLASLWCMLCGEASRVVTMLICDKCSWGWHMGCCMPPMEEVLIGKWFAFSAPNRCRFLGFSSMVIYIWLGIWRKIAMAYLGVLVLVPLFHVLNFGLDLSFHHLSLLFLCLW